MSAIPPHVEIECNKRLLEEVSEEMGVTQALTQSMLTHYSDFIARTIQLGNLDGVFVPYLGKFQVKHTSLQYKNYIHLLSPPLRKIFERNIIHMPPLNDLLNPDTE